MPQTICPRPYHRTSTERETVGNGGNGRERREASGEVTRDNCI